MAVDIIIDQPMTIVHSTCELVTLWLHVYTFATFIDLHL